VLTSMVVSWWWRILAVAEKGVPFLCRKEKREKAWESFRSELHSVVQHMKSYSGGVRYQSKEDFASLALETPPTVEIPVPQRRRSFAEVMMSSKVSEPQLLLTKPITKLSKRAEVEVVQKPKMPVKFDVLQSDAPKAGTAKHAKVMMGHSDFAYAGEGDGLDCQRISLRDTLECIKRDVEKCLVWMDSGILNLPCGLMGSAPKISIAARGDGPAKRKTKLGILGSRPKVVFKPIAGRRVLGQPKSPGLPKLQGFSKASG
jgi:hypothetical protein